MAKKESEATSRVVDVTVPAVKGIALNDIYKAALSSVRDEIPLVSNLAYELDGEPTKKGDERTYKVRISWGPRETGPLPGDPEDGDFVGQHLESLTVPTALPAESDSSA
jgi:hypothetical protein